MTRRSQIIVGSMSGLLRAVAAFFVYVVHRATQVITPNAYAVWRTADLVIEHMEKNDGAWPRSWEELAATSATAYKGTVSTNLDGTVIAEFRPRAGIEGLKKRVEIDWSANPRELVKAKFAGSGPPFRVIWLRNGKSTHYQGKEPNAMVLEYLKLRQQKAAGTGAPAASTGSPEHLEREEPVEWLRRDDGLFQLVMRTRAWKAGQRFSVSEALVIKPDGTVLWR